jgi:hypothetical protein
MNDGLIDHVRLLLQYILTFVSQLGNYIPRPEFTGIMQRVRDDITKVRTGFAEKFVFVIGKLIGLERRIEGLESSGRGDGKISEMQRVKSKLRDLTTQCDNLREQNITLEREMIVLRSGMNGTLLWKIEGYQRKRQDAINGVKTALYSPPFYSDQFGYKICAKIYLNGEGSGKGSHLSLFFVVMKGELITYEEFY